MENKKLLYFNRILAFIAFLCSFGKLFYEWGYNKKHDGFIMLFIFPVFYLIILFISHKFIDSIFYTKKPYIITAIIITVFTVLMWIGFLIAFNGDAVGTFTRSDIVFSCITTICSLLMSIVYFLLALKFKDN